MIGLIGLNRQKIQRSELSRQKIINRWQVMHAQQERGTVAVLRPFFTDIARTVLSRFNRLKDPQVPIDRLFDPEDWADRFRDVMVPRWNRGLWTGVAFEEQYAESLGAIELDDESQRMDNATVDLLTEPVPPPSIHVDPDPQVQERARRWLRGRSVGVWERVGDTTQKQMRRAIMKGIREGKVFKEIAKDLQKSLTNYSKHEALRVARTEMTGAINNGQHLERVHLGITSKIWIMRQDQSVRRAGPKSVYDHWVVHRQIRDSHDPFTVSGELLMYPGDISLGASGGNVIFCRCSGLSYFERGKARTRKISTSVPEQFRPSERLIPKGSRSIDRTLAIEERISRQQGLKEIREHVTKNYKSINAEMNQKVGKARQTYLDSLAAEAADPEDEVAYLQRQSAGREYFDLKDSAREINEKAFAQSQQIFSEVAVPAGRRGSIELDFAKIKNAQVIEKSNRAKQFIENLTDMKNLPEAHRTLVKQIGPSDRAWADRLRHNWTVINMGIADETAIYAHELGHTIELRSSEILRSTQEFLQYRVKKAGTKSEHLRTLFPHHGYKMKEYGNKDDFLKLVEAMGEDPSSAWYIGKQYKDVATEVLSMGIEYLMRDPVTFARVDPEFFDFLIGVLRGVL